MIDKIVRDWGWIVLPGGVAIALGILVIVSAGLHDRPRRFFW
jgi:hypothetical protein